MLPRIAFLAVMLLAPGIAHGQSFEVASIRINKSSRAKSGIEFLPGGERFLATAPLAALVMLAYDLTSPQCRCQSSALPGLWERFDIQAKADRPVHPQEMLRLLQNLLEERFKLTVRREMKELPAYALLVDKTGAKLSTSAVMHTEDDAAPRNGYHARGIEERSESSLVLAITDATMADLAWRLSTLTVLEDHVVIDQTGLTGYYDIELKFDSRSPAGLPSTDGAPSIFTALQEQLGLRLEQRKMPVEFVTVEHAEQPTEN